jgi:hypothetical protein
MLSLLIITRLSTSPETTGISEGLTISPACKDMVTVVRMVSKAW